MTPYLLVDNVRLAAESIENSWSRFRLRLPASEIRLISGSASPAKLMDSDRDSRRLGVLLKSLRWERDGASIDVPIDSFSFVDGFYKAESLNGEDGLVRWTTGDAGLPRVLFPPWEGEVLLRLRLGEWKGSKYAPALSGAAAVLSEFESLGEDCEFGLAQRHYLVEPPLSLFRWAGAPAVMLIEGLDTDFSELDAATGTELIWSGKEYFIRTPFLSIHTNCIVEQDAAGQAEILRCGRATLRILRRKLLKDIADARRIFVFKAIGPKFGEFEMRRLHGALRRIGPATLLCVKETAGERAAGQPPRPGTVEQIGDALFAGYLDQFVIRTNRSFDQWLTICARTLALSKRG